jgi:hypothetical protein
MCLPQNDSITAPLRALTLFTLTRRGTWYQRLSGAPSLSQARAFENAWRGVESAVSPCFNEDRHANLFPKLRTTPRRREKHKPVNCTTRRMESLPWYLKITGTFLPSGHPCAPHYASATQHLRTKDVEDIKANRFLFCITTKSFIATVTSI